jgi:hypothetical protein
MPPEVAEGAVAPVAPAVGTEQPTQTPPDTASAEEEPQKPVEQPKTFTQEDLDRVVQARLAKERRRLRQIADVEADNRVLRQQLETRQQPEQRDPSAEPKASEFKDYEDYLIAKAEWRIEQRSAAKQRETVEQQSKRETQEAHQRLAERIRTASDEFPDFEDVVIQDATLPVTPYMVRFMEENELGAKVLYELAKNRTELTRIAQLSPTRQIVELDALEKKLAAPPKQSAAPAPIRPSDGNASAEVDPEKLPIDQWVKWRNAQLRKPKK